MAGGQGQPQQRLREESVQEEKAVVPRAGEVRGLQRAGPTRVESESQTVGEEQRDVVRTRLS